MELDHSIHRGVKSTSGAPELASRLYCKQKLDNFHLFWSKAVQGISLVCYALLGRLSPKRTAVYGRTWLIVGWDATHLCKPRLAQIFALVNLPALDVQANHTTYIPIAMSASLPVLHDLN